VVKLAGKEKERRDKVEGLNEDGVEK